MATIRSFTSLEQSRKLAEILPLESADMCYEVEEDLDGYITKTIYTPLVHTPYNDDYLPCWSLAALLKILHCNKEDIVSLSYGGYWDGEYLLKWAIDYELEDGDYYKTFADNPIDACVSMIEKLHELNLL